MIKFDGKDISEAIKKKKLYTRIAYALFAPLLIGAVIAAALTRDAVIHGKYEAVQITALSLAVISLLAQIVIIIFFVAPSTRGLNLLVCKAMAEGLLEREDMFKGCGTIEFDANYSADVLTLSRKNYTGAITIEPARLRLTTTQSLGGAGAKIELDLQPLKAVPSLYSSAGSKLWLFLQGYYALHGNEKGTESVLITDNMSKTPLTLQVFSSNTPVKNATKNYFVEKGLIK